MAATSNRELPPRTKSVNCCAEVGPSPSGRARKRTCTTAVTAVIVLRAGETVTHEDVTRHCAAHLSGFKVPKNIFFHDSLPRNASGKILKRVLRERFADATR